MEIQRGKEGMKISQFNAQVGATTGCTLTLLLNTLPPEQQGKKHGIHADAWFGSVRTATEVGLHGHEGVFQIKQYASLYPKSFIKEALNDDLGGVHIALEGTKYEVPLVAVGYRYSQKTILFFIMTKNSGSLNEGESYKMKYTES